MSDDAGQLERLRLLFRLFAATQCRGRSPVYEALSQAIADHEELLHLGPVALAELGASAGLNLLADHYGYRLSGADFEQQSGPTVLVTCELGNGAVAAGILGDRPRITSRLGVDQDPVDLADPAARSSAGPALGSTAALRGYATTIRHIRFDR